LTYTTTINGATANMVGTDGVDIGTAPDGISVLIAEAFEANDILTTVGALTASSIKMGDGEDVLQGGDDFASSEIRLNKGADNATVGDLANSFFAGGKGIDNITTDDLTAGSELKAGKGADTVTSLTVDDNSVINGGNGADAITVEDLLTNSIIHGGKGDDSVLVTGTLGAGGDGTGAIFGGEGDDVITANGTGTPAGIGYIIYGEDGDDTITATGGSNLIFGGAGDDTIDTGAYVAGEVSTISGGSGANTFVFDTGAATVAVTDIITDWTQGTGNSIDFAGALTNIGATVDGAGDALTNADGYYVGDATTVAGISAALDANGWGGDNEVALWNNGTSTFVFVSNTTAAPADVTSAILQLNGIAATSFTLGGGNITGLA